MTKLKIQREIEAVLIQMGVAPKAITKQASYYQDLGLDSLDVAELMMEFELKFGLHIPCSLVENIKTINDTINYISRPKK